MGLSEYEQLVAEFSGLLHDIGKMGIDLEVLHKPAKLSDEEYQLVMSHPVLSERILAPLNVHPFFKQIAPAVRGHHERVDGRGYPDKLQGDQIPLMARVVLVVDTLDAMSQERSYRKGMPIDLVYKELERCAGTQFDSKMVKVFVESHKFWAKEIKDQGALSEIMIEKLDSPLIKIA
jgi:HD-GYP domain-containing protein (c-di-GMP phosphodiesterase class II)